MDECCACPHCLHLNREFLDLQGKASKLQRKIEALQDSVTSLTVKNQLLADENRLLQASKPQIIQIPTSAAALTTKYSQILDDFDALFETQGHEISKLMSDRDRLSSSCFALLSVVARQESALCRYRTATTKLLSFISQSGESATTVNHEFALLGIDTTREITLLQSCHRIERVCAYGGELIQDSDVIRIVNELPMISSDGSSLETVSNWIRQQISCKSALKQEIEAERRKQNSLAKELGRIAKVAHLSSDDGAISSQLQRKIQNWQTVIRGLKATDGLLQESVNVIIQFCSRFEDDINIRCCVGRMKRWIDNSDAIDIVQEINFVLGLLPTLGAMSHNIDSGVKIGSPHRSRR
jgi:hypothetical protein